MSLRTDLVADLFGTVGRFRRTIRRAAGASFVGLTESQAELLRLVARQPGISVSAAAAELGLAANTASTLVSKLSSEGLLMRTPDPDDRRVGRLELTAPAQKLADASRAARRAALAEALDELDEDDTRALAEGLRVLAKLTTTLREKRS
ncbi:MULTISPECIES: MarR family winged helix-turn-helix transcriptional regulator [Mycolicibacterium]|uniref:MarR family transcriptional regulator n=1 Tax=Mycolicibacterium pallens TaxID=370524 RepID=A0ABX8VHI3_9MYCO|nr:MarR family transcriptional regulator [Mycolicibacterium pallens]APE17364.1 MarR family transcriptional regulator [Mycobacterium sp. WY10]QYL17137.1 MarR family transcriptional regulator [Mycolicibacterium pallens]